MFAPPALKLLRAFLNMSDAATLLLFAERVNRQMLKKTPGPKVYVKGAFDRLALVFYKSPGAEVEEGGGAVLSEVLTHREVWMGRGVKKKEKKRVSFFSF